MKTDDEIRDLANKEFPEFPYIDDVYARDLFIETRIPAFVKGYKSCQESIEADKESESIEFANWIALNEYIIIYDGGVWYKERSYDNYEKIADTTTELKEIFNKERLEKIK